MWIVNPKSIEESKNAEEATVKEYEQWTTSHEHGMFETLK